MSDAAERLDWGLWQATLWARTGKVHPTSVAVTALLDAAVSNLLYWSSLDLDASVELDDVVQMLALAQLETQATRPAAPESALWTEVQRRVRRDIWQVRLARGQRHRARWDRARLEEAAGPDGGLAAKEELTWDDVVRRLGWRVGLAVWLTAVEGWTFQDVSTFQEVTRQQVWRRVRRGLAQIRAALAPAP